MCIVFLFYTLAVATKTHVTVRFNETHITHDHTYNDTIEDYNQAVLEDVDAISSHLTVHHEVMNARRMPRCHCITNLTF